jgi:hydroxyethylthiazole kinase
MADAADEVKEMVAISSVLVLNIGTLNPSQVESMLMAGREADRLNIPIVLDPVGAGATRYRTRTALTLLEELKVAVLKGNAGEIGVLAGTGGEVRGVDSVGVSGDRLQVAESLAKDLGTCVVMSGPTDIVTDGRTTMLVDNGHEMMGRISGTGCMASSIVGAFTAVTEEHVMGATAALAAFGIAGELAARKGPGPYSFKGALFDETAALTPERLREKARVRTARA